MDGAAFGVAAMVEFLAVAQINKANEGWSDSSPRWRREYLGEWAADDTSNVYAFRPFLDDERRGCGKHRPGERDLRIAGRG